jgi:hypothetical protein
MPSLAEAARSLLLDRAAAEVGTAFAEAGVPCVLLRGPSLVRWLYPPNQGRTYLDVDLLLAPEGLAAAEQTLEALGYEYVPTMMQRPDDRPIHARTWRRQADSAAVDLHRTIIGARVSDEELWAIVTDETEVIRLGGTALQGLNAPATALVVVLHAAQHGSRSPQPLSDLRHALERLPTATWQAAARLAQRLAATEAFGAGLRLLPTGSALADSLGVEVAATPETLLRSTTPPPTALGFEWLAHVPGIRGKARLLGAKLVPDAEFMRAWSPLARRGTTGLALAYAQRPLWLAWHAPRGFVAWTRARRRARAGKAADG